MVAGIHAQSIEELMHVVLAHGSAGFFFGAGKSRKKEGSQNCSNSDNNKQFHKGEGALRSACVGLPLKDKQHRFRYSDG